MSKTLLKNIDNIAGKFHSLPSIALARSLQVDLEVGLSNDEAWSRHQTFGPNKISENKEVGILLRITQELLNPLVLILVVAFGITIYLGHTVDAIVVMSAIIINIGIALYQEGQAKNIFKELEKHQAKTARVVRNGVDFIVPVADLVPGDVVHVSSGELIPADIRIVSSEDAKADESALTGEWEPVKKNAQALKQDIDLIQMHNMIFAGTLLSVGSVKGIVVQTGYKTEFGKITAGVSVDQELTPLQRQLNMLAYIISSIVVALSVVIVIVGLIRGIVFAEILLIAIAIAVSAVPEGLPSAITAILAVGMKQVLKSGGLVKSLLAAETLGATDIIIADKTGTLTVGEMTAVAIIPAFTDKAPETHEIKEIDCHQEVVLRSALLCSDGFVTTNDEGELLANGRPVEKALVELGLRLGFNRSELNNDDEEQDFLPFESERRFAAVLVKGLHGHYAILSGAPEYMISYASFFYGDDGNSIKMTDSDRARLGSIQSDLAFKGHRLTGVARVSIDIDKFNDLDNLDILQALGKKLEFIGLVSYTDPVRGDVPASIKLAESAGARVIVATGDNQNTAVTIARQAQVINDDRVLLGIDVNNMDDQELYEAFLSTSVFARMRPAQKQRLASVLQARGHVVAMTGDGINDAPALASADVGIAVHSGTDVAKSAADLILLNNSFATIVKAIKEGRRLLDNIRRVVVHRISAGFGEVFLVLVALFLAAPIPILPKQILWINIIQGGLLTFAYAFEPADRDVMNRPPNQQGSRGILNRQVIKLLTYASIAFGFVTIATYTWLHAFEIPLELIRTVMFAILTLDVIVFSFTLKDFNRPIWQINLLSNKFLLLAIAISSGAFIASMSWSPLREMLSLESLNLGFWVLIGAVAVIELIMIELIKYSTRSNYV